MNLAAIRHRNTEEYIYPRGRNGLVLSLFAASEDDLTVTLVYWPRYETDPDKHSCITMPRTLRSAYCDRFETVIETAGISAYTRYCFILSSGNDSLYLGRNGFSEAYDGENFFEYLWPNPTDGFNAPDWAQEQVYYQIFPERFCNGDPALNPECTVSWGSEPDRENFMGGDLKGIIDKLDYIRDLGCTCLYLTPIFKAPSNHKYDTVDYYEIDPHFGTKTDLKALVEGVHARGMRILLDGVFNHCGYYWPPFQDVVQNGKDSAYAGWFFPQSFPVNEQSENYDCVGHYKWMPKINLANPDARNYFIEVGKYWIEMFDTDGWRLDVADEIPTQFWTFFSDAIKRVKPEALLLGETWGDAGKLLTPDRLDTAMNYVFRDAAVDWLAKRKIGVTELDHRINQMLALYPYETALRLYNPLDSHDTARFRYLCADKRMHELAVVLQMTVPGCPAVFYGDEIGLSGDNDPGCRLAMLWDEGRQDHALYTLYQRLIALRKGSPALMHGSFETIVLDESANLYGFKRTYKDETVIVFIHAGSTAYEGTLGETGTLTSLLTGDNNVSSEDGRLHLCMKPFSAEIYKKKEKEQK